MSDFFRVLSVGKSAEAAAPGMVKLEISFNTFPGLTYAIDGGTDLAAMVELANTTFIADAVSTTMTVELPENDRFFARAKRKPN